MFNLILTYLYHSYFLDNHQYKTYFCS